MSPFVLCPKCRRHVKRDAVACPFCAAAPASRVKLGLAVVVMGLGASAIGCYGPPPREVEPGEGTTSTSTGACAGGDAGAAVCDPGDR
jgi:RNA polymerase subunit RPABC4/transcription elongation factor Spt4